VFLQGPVKTIMKGGGRAGVGGGTAGSWAPAEGAFGGTGPGGPIRRGGRNGEIGVRWFEGDAARLPREGMVRVTTGQTGTIPFQRFSAAPPPPWPVEKR